MIRGNQTLYSILHTAPAIGETVAIFNIDPKIEEPEMVGVISTIRVNSRHRLLRSDLVWMIEKAFSLPFEEREKFIYENKIHTDELKDYEFFSNLHDIKVEIFTSKLTTISLSDFFICFTHKQELMNDNFWGLKITSVSSHIQAHDLARAGWDWYSWHFKERA